MSLVNRNKVNMGSIVIHTSKQHMERTGQVRKYQNYPNLGVGARGVSNRNRIYSKAVCATFSFTIPAAPTNVSLVASDSTSMTLLIEAADERIFSYLIVLTPVGAGSTIQKVSTSKSVTIDNLDSNKSYTISVKSTNPAGSSIIPYTGGSNTYYTTIEAPTNLSVTEATTNSLTIKFTPEALTGVLSYIVSYTSTLGTTTITDISGTDLRTDDDQNKLYTINGLASGTLYTIGVSALGSKGQSTYVKTTEDTLTESPTNLLFSDVTTTSFGFSYTAPTKASTIDMYRITYGISGETTTTTVDVSNNVTSRTLTGLTPNTEYEVSVVTNNKNGATAGDSVALTDTQYTYPESPTSIAVENIAKDTATITFTEPTQNTDLSYSLVYYPTNTTTYPLSTYKTTVSIRTSSYPITNLLYPLAYTVELKSVNDVAGTSSSTVTTSFNTPDDIPTKPTSLENTVTDSTITVSYQPPTSGTVDNYIIKYMNVSGLNEESAWANPDVTTTIDTPYLQYTITGLLESIAYFIRVYAYNANGISTEYATFYSNDGSTETTVSTVASEVIDIYVPKNFTERLAQSVTL